MSHFMTTSWGNDFQNFIRTLYPDPMNRHGVDAWWSDCNIRWYRYQYLWAFYDQSIYWNWLSDEVKRGSGLYKNIRPIFNPNQKIVEFHVTHNMGGRLDREGGNGKSRPSALPIILGKKASEELTSAIGKLWADSHWQTHKSLYVRLGTALGDTGLELVDDPVAKCIRMRVVHPAEVKESHADAYGNLTRIVLERPMPDPEDKARQSFCVYREEITLDDGIVYYCTYRNGTRYAFPGTKGDGWESPFPFIPVDLNQHINQGFPWGVSEIAASIPKSMEMDDQGSTISDAGRRMANGPWLLSGATLGNDARPPRPHDDNPFGPKIDLDKYGSGRDVYTLGSAMIGSRADMSIMECRGNDVKMTPLVFPLPVAELSAFTKMIMDSNRDDYPELEADVDSASGAASGRALRVARQKVTEKIQERRASYEETLVRAQTKALVMGGYLRYKGYESFNLASLIDGKADHYIGERPVFPADPLDLIEIQTAKATGLKTYAEAGVPLRAAMMFMEFQTEDIDNVEAMRESEKEQENKAELDRMNAMIDKSQETPTGNGANPADPSATQTGDATKTTMEPPQ